MPVASYLSVPEPGSSTGVVALLIEGAVRLPIGVTVAKGTLPAAGSSVQIGDGFIVTHDHTWRPVRWWDPVLTSVSMTCSRMDRTCSK